MTNAETGPKQYWVLLGTPQGPYPFEELQRKAGLGTVPPETPVCEVGASEWFPYSRIVPATPETSPEASVPFPPDLPDTAGRITASPDPAVTRAALTAPTPIAAEASYSTASLPAKASTKSPAVSVGAGVGIAVAILAFAGLAYGLYEIVRSPTPMEVCRRFDGSETVVEAKRYATTRMYPFLEKMFAEKSPDDPNDTFEWTREVDGPDATVKHVGFRGTWFVQEEGRRITVEGYFRLVDARGWKIDDMLFTGFEGRNLPGPVSAVGELQKSGPSASAKPTTRSTRPSDSTPPPFKPTPIGVFKWLQHRPAIEVAGIIGIAVIGVVVWSRTAK